MLPRSALQGRVPGAEEQVEAVQVEGRVRGRALPEAPHFCLVLDGLVDPVVSVGVVRAGQGLRGAMVRRCLVRCIRGPARLLDCGRAVGASRRPFRLLYTS